jgi:hypothetical protein
MVVSLWQRISVWGYPAIKTTNMQFEMRYIERLTLIKAISAVHVGQAQSWTAFISCVSDVTQAAA